MNPRRRLILLASFALAAPASAALAAEPTPAERLRAIDAAKVSFAEALRAAEGQVVGGLAFKVELTRADQASVYEVSFLLGEPVHVVTLDAESGKVVSQRDARPMRDHIIIRERDKEPHIGLIQALDIAAAQFSGFRPFAVETAVKGNEIFFEVRMVSKQEAVLHARLTPTGDIIRAGPPPAPPGKKAP